jgi:hypothetical protein
VAHGIHGEPHRPGPLKREGVAAAGIVDIAAIRAEAMESSIG